MERINNPIELLTEYNHRLESFCTAADYLIKGLIERETSETSYALHETQYQFVRTKERLQEIMETHKLSFWAGYELSDTNGGYQR